MNKQKLKPIPGDAVLGFIPKTEKRTSGHALNPVRSKYQWTEVWVVGKSNKTPEAFAVEDENGFLYWCSDLKELED